MKKTLVYNLIINTDSILPNTRSQHVLEKIGFKYIGISNNRKNYMLERKDYKN